MSASRQLRAMGGPVAEIADLQRRLAEFLRKLAASASLDPVVVATLATAIESDDARKICAQTLLDTYLAGETNERRRLEAKVSALETFVAQLRAEVGGKPAM